MLYAVMRFQTEVTFCAPSGAEVLAGPIKGLAGFIPVYHTEDEALEASENGKYKIMTIKTIEDGR